MTRGEDDEVVNKRPTSSNLFAPGFFLTKLLMFPFAIQSDIIANRVSDIATPMSGRTCGPRRKAEVAGTRLCNKSIGFLRRRYTYGVSERRSRFRFRGQILPFPDNRSSGQYRETTTI